MSFVLYDGTENPPIPLNPPSSHHTHEIAQAYIDHLRDVIHLGNDGQYHVNQYFEGTYPECLNFVNNIEIFAEEDEDRPESPISVLDFDKIVSPMSMHHINNIR